MSEKTCPVCGCPRKQHSTLGCVNHSFCPVTYMDGIWKSFRSWFR